MSKNKDFKKLLSGINKKQTEKINPLKRLSLCMIVKNEEKNLGRCLKSVQDVVDEMIIVDTGSTDDTVKIAEEYGAKVYHYKWDNDFGSARNYSLDKATGDWILVLDADEEIPSECKNNIRSLLVDIDVDIAFNVRIRNISSNINDPTQSINNYMVRMFINKPSIRYHGKIHEYINLTSINLSEDNIYILHHGYKDPELSLKKQKERNIPIFDEILNNPETSQEERTWVKFYAGSAKIQVNQIAEGIKLLEEFIQETKDFSGGGPISLAYFMLMSDASVNDINKLKKLLENAERDIPYIKSSPEYWNYKGMANFEDKKYEEALDNFIESVNLSNTENTSFSMMVIENTVVSSLYNICYLSLSLKKKDIFEKYLSIIEEKYNHIDKYRLVTSDLYKTKGDLEKFYDINIDIYKNTNNDEDRKKSIKNLSNYYLEKGDFVNAIEYQSKLHNNEGNKYQWHKLADLSIINNDSKKAEDIYKKIIEIIPDDLDTYLLMGELLVKANKKDQGLEYLNKSYQLSKSEPDRIRVFQTYVDLSLFDELNSLINNSLEKASNDYSSDLFKAKIMIKKNDYKSSEDILKNLVAEFPNKIEAFIELGNLLLNKSDYENAIIAFENALKLNNKDINIIDTLSLLYFNDLEYDKALNIIEKGLEIDPDNTSLKFLKSEIDSSQIVNS